MFALTLYDGPLHYQLDCIGKYLGNLLKLILEYICEGISKSLI